MIDSIKSYLITNNSYYGNNMDSLASNRFQYNFLHICKIIYEIKGKHIDFACFRYDNASLLNTYEYAVLYTFIDLCHKFNIEPIINLSNNKYEILSKLYDDGINIGIHFKESDMSIIENNILNKIRSMHNKGNILSTFYSAHNITLANKALRAGIDYVTISPIYYNKGKNDALGINFLHNIPSYIKCKSFALGGIDTDDKIQEISNCSLLGFASISYFLNIANISCE